MIPTWINVLIGIIAFLVVVTIWIYIHLHRIAKRRVGEDFDSFKASFAEENLSDVVMRAVFAAFQERCHPYCSEFPVRADDELESIYGLPYEELEAMMADTLNRCDKDFLPQEQIRQKPAILTIRDFVYYVALCPDKEPVEPKAGSTDQ